MFLPDGSERKRLGFFHECQAGGDVAGALCLAQERCGLEQSGKEGLDGRAGADDPGRDAVDAGIEEIEADVCAAKKSPTHKFLHDGTRGIIHQHHMVTVPADAATHMEQDLGNELQDRRDFIREVFRGVEMTGVQAIQELVFYGVAEVELVGADDIALRADAEEFALHGVEVELAVNRSCKNLVERGLKALAGRLAVIRHVLRAIGNPDIRDYRRADLLRNFRTDLTAGDAVVDPEFADRLVRMRECEPIGGERMGEIARIEINPESPRLAPIHPALELSDRVGIAIHTASGKVGVAGMDIQSVLAGNERERLVEIGTELRDRAGLAGIVARGLDAATFEF